MVVLLVVRLFRRYLPRTNGIGMVLVLFVVWSSVLPSTLCSSTFLLVPPPPPPPPQQHQTRKVQYMTQRSYQGNELPRQQQRQISTRSESSLLFMDTTTKATTTTVTTSTGSNNDVRSSNIRTASSSSSNTSNNSSSSKNDPFVKAMVQLQYTPEQCATIISQLQIAGLWDETITTTPPDNYNNNNNDDDDDARKEPSFTLRTLTNDYIRSKDNNDSTTISTILIRDFQIPPLVAHQTRTALLHLYHHHQQQQKQQQPPQIAEKESAVVTEFNSDLNALIHRNDATSHQTKRGKYRLNEDDKNQMHYDLESTITTTATSKSLEQRYKSTIVRPVAQRRLAMCQSTTSKSNKKNSGADHHNDSVRGTTNMFAYSLHPIEDYPICQQELQEFYHFMTLPSTDSQEETPIRPATANIYIRHAKLFLGWYWSTHLLNILPEPNDRHKGMLSLYVIFPTKDKVYANSILQYIMWLRTTRYIAVSYEANLLRGLCKLLKFRYRKESLVPNSNDPDADIKTSSSNQSNGNKGNNDDTTSFNDIPVIRELRKLHRDANRRQAVAPRVSNEDHKWLSWPDYIQVVQRTKDDLMLQIQEFERTPKMTENKKKPKQQPKCSMNIYRRRIAVLYQKYLVLSFFANVPDRQRTIRELEIGRSFVRDNVNGQWCIKHTPDDYKTGKTYGERPPLQLPTSLTIDIDDFIARWRPALLQSSGDVDSDDSNDNNFLFLGPRTGTPLSSDAVYHTVSKTCYFYTGKRTNPHLLRDMIVTHVRESPSVTEQQLEALALFMGHSAAIQRKSYDRRTLTKKVAPAIALMEQVNANSRST